MIAAGSAALLAGRSSHEAVEEAPPPPPPRLSQRAKRILLAAALCGGTLLAFEVVWVRFLQLFMTRTSSVFAVMLAVVLAGIGGGGLVTSAWLRRRPNAQTHPPVTPHNGIMSPPVPKAKSIIFRCTYRDSA